MCSTPMFFPRSASSLVFPYNPAAAAAIAEKSGGSPRRSRKSATFVTASNIAHSAVNFCGSTNPSSSVSLRRFCAALDPESRPASNALPFAVRGWPCGAWSALD